MCKGSGLIHIVQLISMVHYQIALIAVINRPVKFHTVNKLFCLYGCRELRSNMKLLFRQIHIKIKELRITVIHAAASHNRYKIKPLLLQIVQNVSALSVHFTHQ